MRIINVIDQTGDKSLIISWEIPNSTFDALMGIAQNSICGPQYEVIIRREAHGFQVFRKAVLR